MPCYFPVTLYMSKTVNSETGKRSLVSASEGFRDMPRKVPCGRCEGCKLERSRQWAIRCDCERQMHQDNSFITLTYSDKELVYGGAKHGILVPRHLQLFWKRLRKRTGKSFRYFACGEYGDKSNRPHYHACVFGLDFQDKKLFSSKDGNNLYTSDFLESVWTHGLCTVGDVNFQSAAYVARYIMKKRLGWMSQYYEAEGITPEFVVMSRGGRTGLGGIGTSWFEKFESDVFPRDEMVIRGGVKCKPPKFFSKKYEKTHPLNYEDIADERKISAIERWEESTPERLAVRYRVKKAQIGNLIRKL